MSHPPERTAKNIVHTPNLPIVFHKGDHIPDRPGFSKNPGGKRFEEMRRQISQVCRKHNSGDNAAYGVCDDQWGDETRYIHVETSEISREWIEAIVKKLQTNRKWAVGVSNIPEGYLMIFADGIHVCGPAFRGAKTLDELIARARHRLRLDWLLRNCRNDRDLAELVASGELRTKAISYFSLTAVTDAGLTHLSGLPRIRNLSLLSPKVSIRGLAHLRPLTQLTDLALSGTRITDLADLPPLPKLKSLGLEGSKITDAGLAALEHQPALEELSLERTKISARGLIHLARLRRLKKLCLRHCAVGDDSLRALQGFPRLQNLDLQRTRVTDQGACLLANLKLRELDLSGTELTDVSIPHLVKLKGLQELCLFNPKFSPVGIERLREALPKCNVISP